MYIWGFTVTTEGESCCSSVLVADNGNISMHRFLFVAVCDVFSKNKIKSVHAIFSSVYTLTNFTNRFVCFLQAPGDCLPWEVWQICNIAAF